MPRLWVVEAAEQFWELAGVPEPFPRSLRASIAYGLPLAVILLPRLRVRAVDDWLRRQRIACRAGTDDRGLRACLVAHSGAGFIFLDGTDPEDEQRFSLAHELAHFLRDYLRRRQRVNERLGPAALDTLDGLRAPRTDERVHALLTRTDLSFQIHLMERAPDGSYRTSETDQSERDADRLACEILAPAERIADDLRSDPEAERPRRAVEILMTRYGLPRRPAEDYAAHLFPPSRPASPLLRWLGSGA